MIDVKILEVEALGYDGHVFISYVDENENVIYKIKQILEKNGIKTWTHKDDIKVGSYSRERIQEAIEKSTYFLACFSKEYRERDRTYMNEELTIAIDELRKRHTDKNPWFIQIKLNQCEIPKRDIGNGKTLMDIQYLELLPDLSNVEKLVETFGDGKLSETLFKHNDNIHLVQDQVDMAISLVEKGNIDDAIELLSNAIDNSHAVLGHDPSLTAECYMYRGIAYRGKRMFDKSFSDLNKAIELRPDDGRIYCSRGLTYMAAGEDIKAYNDIIKANTLSPSEPAIKENLKYIKEKLLNKKAKTQ